MTGRTIWPTHGLFLRSTFSHSYLCGTFFRIQDSSKPMSLEILFYLIPRSRKKASVGTRMQIWCVCVPWGVADCSWKLGLRLLRSHYLYIEHFYTPANEVRGCTVLHSSVRPINCWENRWDYFTEIWCEDTSIRSDFFFIFAILPIFWPPGSHLENQAGGRLSTIDRRNFTRFLW
jgi:hypothetical protein